MQISSFQLLFSLLFLIFLLTILFIGFYIIKRCGSPFPKLFYEFDKKIWMTLGLGLIFFGFYLVLILTLSWILDAESSQQIFSFVYHHKVESIYMGLFIFSFTTLSIYLARLFIKYLYTNRMAKKRGDNDEFR